MSLKCIGSMGAVLALSACLMQGAWAQDHASDEPVVTHHTIAAHGQELQYTARVGYLSIRDEENVVHGRMFYRAYVLDQPAGAVARPLIFAWNGGPGSNASLQELGALGPRRIEKSDAGVKIVDNADTWLQFADVVFIDPINTGYSYASSPEHLKEFTNDQGDADSVAEFIRIYRRHFGVEGAPVYIEGESYGTYRAAGVAEILAARKIPLKGVILLSTVLNFEHPAEYEAAFVLPNYAATAFVHHRLGAELEKNLEATTAEVKAWAESEYLAALVMGDRLPEGRKKEMAARLARYTGVPAEVWAADDLIVGADEFAQNVLGADKLEYVGHYDTRDVGKIGQVGEPYNVNADPSLDYGVDGVVTGYFAEELGWRSDAFYAGPFGGRWPTPASFRGDWASVRWGDKGGTRDRSEALVKALQRTPGLRVLVGSGYYDLSTPYAATEYTFSHLGLPAGLKGRIAQKVYPGGHAAYMDPAVRVTFAEDVRRFVAADAK